HIGFNEPGTPFSSRTSVVDLVESTINANSRFFDSIDDVSTQAISMGINTIMESQEIILLASGDSKAEAIASLINGEMSDVLLASILKYHKRLTVIDEEAALSKT